MRLYGDVQAQKPDALVSRSQLADYNDIIAVFTRRLPDLHPLPRPGNPGAPYL